jgi:hypothetical protein
MREKRQVPPGSGAYTVGKWRPPVATRWKKGQSGNATGRPKGTKNMATYFHEALSRKVEIREGGRVRKVTVREAIPLKVTTLALKGDYKAISLILAKDSEITAALERENIRSITPDMSSEQAMKIYERFLKGDYN